MNHFKTMLVILFFVGTSLYAGGPMLFNNGSKSDFKIVKKSAYINRIHFPRSPFIAAGGDDEKDITSSGLFVNFSFFFPSGGYMDPYYSSGDDKYGMGYDLEFGNYIRILKLGAVAFGLRVTWLELGYTSIKYSGFDLTVSSISAAPLHLGPYATIAINDNMAIDAFYQLGFQYTFEDDNHDNNASFMGLSQELGLCYRLKIFSLGAGYRLGKLKNVDQSKDKDKYSINNVRLILGLRF